MQQKSPLAAFLDRNDAAREEAQRVERETRRQDAMEKAEFAEHAMALATRIRDWLADEPRVEIKISRRNIEEVGTGVSYVLPEISLAVRKAFVTFQMLPAEKSIVMSSAHPRGPNIAMQLNGDGVFGVRVSSRPVPEGFEEVTKESFERLLIKVLGRSLEQ